MPQRKSKATRRGEGFVNRMRTYDAGREARRAAPEIVQGVRDEARGPIFNPNIPLDPSQVEDYRDETALHGRGRQAAAAGGDVAYKIRMAARRARGYKGK